VVSRVTFQPPHRRKPKVLADSGSEHERSSVQSACEQQTELLSITIAHPDEGIAERIKTKLAECSGIPVNQITPETDSASALPSSPDQRPLHERMPDIFASSDDGEDHEGSDSEQSMTNAEVKRKKSG
jgi:hypothetical protein